MTKKLLVIGSSNIDMVNLVDQIPQPGETVGGGEFFLTYGGKGANQALAAHRAGADSYFLTAVGTDIFGKQLKEHYQNEGMRFNAVCKKGATGIALIHVERSTAENAISIAPGANGLLDWDSVMNFPAYQNADVLLLQNEINLLTIEMVIKHKPTHNKYLIYNPAPFIPIDSTLYQFIDLLIVNEHELAQLTGQPIDGLSISNSLKKLREYGLSKTIITQGRRGATLWDCNLEKEISFGPYQVTSQDTTGAGDTFCGYLAACISRGHDLTTAIRMSSAAAAISTTLLGAQAAIPYYDEVLAFMEDYKG